MNRPVVSYLAILFFAATVTGADDFKVLRHRYLEGKPQTLRAVTTIGESLPLRLFDDVQFNARLVSIEDDPLNGFVWRGEIEGTPGGWVVLVDDNGCMAGTIATGESFFRILCLGNKAHVIEEVEPPENLIDDSMVPEAEGWIPSAISGMVPLPLEQGEIVEVDVLVVYTRKAARKLFRDYDTGFSGKNKAMRAYIKLAIAIGNAAFENSEVDIRLRLVKSRPIGYKATGDSSTDLRRLRDIEDGFIDKVHLWRERHGADFVSLVLDDFEPEFSGRGFQVPPGPWTDRHLFSVVNYDALWWYTLVHELGHNMGLAHDTENDDAAAVWRSYRYSRGYRDPAAGFRTIMAYRNGCDSCRWKIPHFSNKNITWQGAPTGNPAYPLTCGDGESTGPQCGRKTGSGKANCAKSLNKTREFYASVRPCKVGCGG